MNHIIVMDVGTSGMLTSIYDEKGDVHYSTYSEYRTEFIYPSMVEQDPKDWRDATIHTLKNAAEYAAKNNAKLIGIAISSQRASLIPVEKDGTPMRKALMWQDKRTIAECEEMRAQITMEELYVLTGLRLSPYAVVPRMLWMKNHQPEIFNKAHKLIGVQDYVIHCLTGNFKTDWTQAARTMLMNIKKFAWEPELLQLAGVTEDKLCELVPSASNAGGITAEMADLTGLPQGMPVIIGGGDQQCAALALNVVSPGKAEANTGSGSFVIGYTDTPKFDQQCRVICSASAIPGKWILEAGIFNTGAIYRWFRDQYCYDLLSNEKPYNLMNKEVEASPAGARGVMMLPHFEGAAAPYWEPKGKGTFFNLSLGTTRGDMLRSVMEGISMEITDIISLLENLSGKIDEVTIAGGMARADIFAQIQADAIGALVTRSDNAEASSLGAAISGMTTLGVYSSVETAAKVMMGSNFDHFNPSPENHALYKKLRDRKDKLFYALQQGGVYDEFMD